MKNIYEKLDIIELEELDEMAEIFIEDWYENDKKKNIALVAGRDLVEYVMEELLGLDATSVKYIDLLEEDDEIPGEWVVMLDPDGNITVHEICYYSELDNAEVVYISMEDEISQYCINHCLNNNAEVHLFGYADDEECDCDCECGKCDFDCKKSADHKNDAISYKTEDDGMHGFTASRSTDHGVQSYSFYSSEKMDSDGMLKLLKEFGF